MYQHSGAISVIGTGNGTGNYNFGVDFEVGGIVQAAGTGTITIIGTGSTDGDSYNYGVCLGRYSGGANISSASGNITIIGNGGGSGSGSDNYGVYLENVGTNLACVTST